MSEAYALIDRFLRNNLDDADYATFSDALEAVLASLPSERPEAEDARDAQIAELREALRDMLSGWRYIRDSHGDLYGVGWDRAQDKAEAALAASQGAKE